MVGFNITIVATNSTGFFLDVARTIINSRSFFMISFSVFGGHTATSRSVVFFIVLPFIPPIILIVVFGALLALAKVPVDHSRMLVKCGERFNLSTLKARFVSNIHYLPKKGYRLRQC